jgi:histone-lysine N-methyltransferase MLL5
MGLDKNNIPEKYLCEVCRPRPVDRKRARAMQARRRSEIFKRNSSSDDSDADDLGRNSRPGGKSSVKKPMLDRSKSGDKLKKLGGGPPGSATKNGKGKGFSLLTEKANRLIRDKKNITKISWKKKTAAERSSGEGKNLVFWI